jgi:SP family sugar:H+ symporter-like MFS transporter
MGNFYNYLVSFSAAVGGLLFGYEVGVVSQVLGMTTFQSYYGLAGDEMKSARSEFDGNITFTFLIGCVFGTCQKKSLKVYKIFFINTV